jgi:hypothetical protein
MLVKESSDEVKNPVNNVFGSTSTDATRADMQLCFFGPISAQERYTVGWNNQPVCHLDKRTHPGGDYKHSIIIVTHLRV